MISIICPIYNEEKHIAKCLDSILAQDYPHEDMEVLLVDGMSVDRTRDIVMLYQEKYPFIQLLDNPCRTVPYAMNVGIIASKGNVIIRLDAHCIYPQNYTSELVSSLTRLNADNVGAVCNTKPAKENSVCYSIAICSSHRFGVGNSEFRIGVDDIKEVDTVPFGCYKRDVFDMIGLFDEELTRNQDDEFNARLIKNGGKIYLIPSLVIDYSARDSFFKMSKMYYQYGLFKPLVNKKLGKAATVRQFFPPTFVAGVFIGAILSLLFPFIGLLYSAVWVVYLLFGLCFGIRSAFFHKRYSLVFLMPYTFLLIHASYGYGYLKGIYNILTKQKFSVEVNH